MVALWPWADPGVRSFVELKSGRSPARKIGTLLCRPKSTRPSSARSSGPRLALAADAFRLRASRPARPTARLTFFVSRTQRPNADCRSIPFVHGHDYRRHLEHAPAGLGLGLPRTAP